MLSWDVIVLNGYLVLNGYITPYLLFTKFRGKKPERKKYVPFVFLAIAWAVSIHTVTAFLYSGMGARPHWNAAILAPRFLASAFAAGPSLMIIALTEIRDRMGFPVKDAALNRLRQIVAVTMLINLFFFFSEIFTELYSFKHHAASMRYLLFGLHGHTKLVPYIWARDRARRLRRGSCSRRESSTRARSSCDSGCAAAVLGVWVEKGMGLVIPGFVPSPLGEIVDYIPSFTEFCVSAAIWATGALIYTLLLKAAVPIELGKLRMKARAERRDGVRDLTRSAGSARSRAARRLTAPDQKPIDPPVSSPDAIPDAPVSGTIHGTPFVARDMRYVVDAASATRTPTSSSPPVTRRRVRSDLARQSDERVAAARRRREDLRDATHVVGELPSLRRRPLDRRASGESVGLHSRRQPRWTRLGRARRLFRLEELRLGLVRRDQLSVEHRSTRARLAVTRAHDLTAEPRWARHVRACTACPCHAA